MHPASAEICLMTSDCLAARLAHMPDAHPAAWPASDRAGNGGPARASTRRAGEPETWWRGDPDAWWRGPDPSTEAAGNGDGDVDEIDDADGLGDFGGIDDAGTGASSVDRGGAAEAGEAADSGGPGEADAGRGHGGGRAARARPGRSTATLDRSGYQQRDGFSIPHPGPAGPDEELYRPWFSVGGPGDPWFAAGRR